MTADYPRKCRYIFRFPTLLGFARTPATSSQKRDGLVSCPGLTLATAFTVRHCGNHPTLVHHCSVTSFLSSIRSKFRYETVSSRGHSLTSARSHALVWKSGE